MPIQHRGQLLTSSLMKYLSVKSFRDSTKVRLRNCLLSFPFFNSVDSNVSGSDISNQQKGETSYDLFRKLMLIQVKEEQNLDVNNIVVQTFIINLVNVVIFSCELSSFILCTNPLIPEDTKSSTDEKQLFKSIQASENM